MNTDTITIIFPEVKVKITIFKKIREGLGKRKGEQKIVKDLLLSNQIDRALTWIKGMVREKEAILNNH